MVMKKSYYSLGGEIIGEKAGGVRTDYLTDALGSVTATVDQTGTIINRYTYKPYGGLLAKTGVGADPSYQWVGGLGYRQTSKKYSDVYVRARHYDAVNGRWTTKDPLGETIQLPMLYTYAAGRVTVFVDPSGFVEMVAQPNAVFGKSPGFAKAGAPVDCCCGAYVAPVKFIPSNQVSCPGDGWIIQLVTVNWDIKNCNGSQHKESIKCRYLEVFDLSYNVDPRGSRTDTFSRGKSVGSTSKGATMEGEVKFFCKATVGNLKEQGFISNNKDPKAKNKVCGGLPGNGQLAKEISDDDSNLPDWWRLASQDGTMTRVTRRATADWDCCCEGNSSLWTSTTNANPPMFPTPKSPCP